MLGKDKRVRIITGHYGSGKTEFSVNYAMKLKEEKDRVAIADLDIVNPYFRSRERENEFLDKGIKVVYSNLKTQTLDLPSVSGEVDALIAMNDYNVILDVGGDNVGAKLLYKYKELLRDEEYDFFVVVNVNRPETSSVDKIKNYVRKIENAAGKRATALINNSHFLKATTVEDIISSQEIVEEASKQLEIPLRYISCMEHLAKELPEELRDKTFSLKLFMRDEWMS